MGSVWRGSGFQTRRSLSFRNVQVCHTKMVFVRRTAQRRKGTRTDCGIHHRTRPCLRGSALKAGRKRKSGVLWRPVGNRTPRQLRVVSAWGVVRERVEGGSGVEVEEVQVPCPQEVRRHRVQLKSLVLQQRRQCQCCQVKSLHGFVAEVDVVGPSRRPGAPLRFRRPVRLSRQQPRHRQ